MRNLEGSGWMTKPDLSIIEATDGTPGLPYAFTLAVLLANPNAPKDLDGDGVPDAVPPVDVAPAAAMPATAPAVAPEPTPAPAAAPEQGAAS
jgi:type IV pilus assembly protein PilN